MSDYILSCCSTVDLTPEHMQRRNLAYACFHFQLDGKDYMDDLGQSMKLSDFYAAMQAGADTATSQINTAEYLDYFSRFLEQGKDVLHVCLSSGLSGSFNSANSAALIARERYPERKIYIVDSLAASSGFGLLMDTAADLLFYSVMMLRLLPEMIALLPVWIWYLVAFAVVLRLAGYAVVALRFHCFAAAHTWGSKLCGGTIFLIPYLLRTPAGTVYCVSTAVVAVLSAAETLALHVLSTESRTDVRGLWQLAAARERPSEE